MTMVIDGKQTAKEIRAELREEAQRLGIVPGLCVILVGDDPASAIYVRNKARACKDAGFYSRTIKLPAETAREELLACIREQNADPQIHGILVQLPLPKHLDEQEILSAIDPAKDADGFLPVSAGKLLLGQKAPVACTPQGCMELLKRSNVPMEGAHAVVVGRSNIVGKPMALLLLRENCTVTVCHSRTKNLPEICRTADILVAAIGKPRFIKGDWIKPGAAVIDVGINRLEDGSITGDVDYEAASQVAGWITPVPGGVGPMTIAMLLKNTLEAAKRG